MNKNWGPYEESGKYWLVTGRVMTKDGGERVIRFYAEKLRKGKYLKVHKDGSRGDTLVYLTGSDLISEVPVRMSKKYGELEIVKNPNEDPQVFTGKQIAREVKALGSDQGGFSDYQLDQIKRENYVLQKIKIGDLRKMDEDLDNYLKVADIREFEGEPFGMDPIVSSEGEVLDGYNRIAQALEDKNKEIVVLRGIKK